MISRTRPRAELPMLQRLGRDYAFVLPGLPIAIFSFSLLLALTVVSVATFVIWVGALLLPLTLMVASGFAALDRSRLRLWGADAGPVTYRPREAGLAGILRLLGDPRRWLDLVFEMIIAFPLRLLTFIVALVWTVLSLGGLTYVFWSLFLPGERNTIELLELIQPELIPDDDGARFLIDAGAHFVLGLILLLTLPAVMSALARSDAFLTGTLLGAEAASAHDNADVVRYAPAAAGSRHSGSFSGRAWAWIGTGFAAIALLAVAWPVMTVVYALDVAVAMALVLLHCVSLVITLRWAWIGMILSLGAAGGLMLVTVGSGVSVWPWPVTALITQCAVLVVAALARPWYVAASGWCASAVLTLGALLAVAPNLPRGALSTGIVFGSVSAGVVLLTALSRMWIVNADRLEAAERSSAEQDRRRKELQERNRIARELHDVVAHSMSVISVQAATARYRNPSIDEAAQREFDEIAGSSRQALGEMRMLLSILRGEDDVPTAPEPGLQDLGALIEATRASGTEIRTTGDAAPGAAGGTDASEGDAVSGGLSTVSSALRSVSSATGLAAYRTVQEALSNALRHAPGAAVVVDLAVEGAESPDSSRALVITVTNEAPPQKLTTPAPGAGLGLAGIRERTAAVGGTVETGPTEEGGFRVRAILPF